MTNNYKHIHSQTIDLYERQASNWDLERTCSVFFEQSWIDKCLLHVPMNGSVLDFGCGGGYPISTYISNKGFSITGIDTSQTLLNLCKKRCAKDNWMRMDMRKLKLTKTFNFIIAWDSFFHLNFNEQREVLKDLCSLLNPEGVILITVGPEEGESLGTVGGEQVYHASLSYDEYKSILEESKVKILEFKKEDPTCGFHTVLMARRCRT